MDVPELNDRHADAKAVGRLKGVALAIAAAGCAISLFHATTCNVWDDEAHSFFLSNRPTAEIIRVLSTNIYEDPPLYNVMLGFWIPLTGYNPLLLRLGALLFWIPALAGIFILGRRLGGPRTGWYALIVASLMPYHWLFAITVRWFSLFACLAVWNFIFFLNLREKMQDGHGVSRPRTSCLRSAAGYAVTGAGMWYTNYVAPVFFLSHLVICLGFSAHQGRLGKWLLGCWTTIGLLYLPWLPILIRQVPISVGRPFSPAKTLYALWVMAVGDFATPFAWWIAVPLVLSALFAAGLTWIQFRRVRLPLAVSAVFLAALLLSKCIMPLRLMMVTPFLAVCLALCLAERPLRAVAWWRGLRRGFVALALIALAGVSVNVVRQYDWCSYRAIDPVKEALGELEADWPDSLVLTNSDCVLFYRGDAQGELGRSGVLEVAPAACRGDTAFYPVDDRHRHRLDRRHRSDVAGMVRSSERVAYVHHSLTGPYSRIRSRLADEFAGYGLREVQTKSFLAVPASYLRMHPLFRGVSGSGHDNKRVVVVYFAAKRQDDPASVRLATRTNP